MPLGSTKNPRVRRYRLLAGEPSARREQGACVVEGPRLLAELLDDGVLIEALIAPSCDESLARRLRDALGESAIDVEPRVLAACSDTATHQGVIALATRPEDAPIPRSGGRALLVAWDVQDPGNVGTLARSAEGAGCVALVVGGGCADPLSPRALRASAGSAFRVPLSAWDASPEALASRLDELGWRRIATVPRGGRAPHESDLRDAALLVGSEARGLPAPLAAGASEVTIPLAGRCESLNAGVAGSILAFEAARQAAAGEGTRR